MNTFIILLSFFWFTSFTSFATEIVIDDYLLELSQRIKDEQKKTCGKISVPVSKWKNCKKEIAYRINKETEVNRIGTEAHAKKNYYNLTTKELKAKSLELEALYKKVRGSNDFMLLNQKSGELRKSMVGSANNFIHQELNRRKDKESEYLVNEYNRLLGKK